MPNELVNPLTGETIVDCADRLMRVAQMNYTKPGDALAYTQVRVECFMNSAMAHTDPRLADFYQAVLSHLTRGTSR